MAMKISNDLERVGDHASKVGRAVETLSKHAPIPLPPQLGEMAGAALAMLSDSLRAYTDRNPELAREVRARDGRVNEYRNSLHRTLVTYMFEDARRITPALELILVSQSLERVADLATNIAEEVVFLVEGTVIRHSPSDGGDP
jgi:phosphate transport system protein